jgi:hypothetical protein
VSPRHPYLPPCLLPFLPPCLSSCLHPCLTLCPIPFCLSASLFLPASLPTSLPLSLSTSLPTSRPTSLHPSLCLPPASLCLPASLPPTYLPASLPLPPYLPPCASLPPYLPPCLSASKVVHSLYQPTRFLKLLRNVVVCLVSSSKCHLQLVTLLTSDEYFMLILF